MTLLSLAQVLLDGRMQKRFASDPAFQATALLLQERIPRASALYLPATPASDAPHGAGRRRQRGAVVQRARHAGARRAAAVERPLPRRGHQRRRRLQPVEGPGRHPLARGRHLGQLGHVLLHPGRRRAAPSGPRRTSRRAQPADRFEAVFSEARAEFRSRTQPDRELHRDRGLARRRCRAAPAAPDQLRPRRAGRSR